MTYIQIYDNSREEIVSYRLSEENHIGYARFSRTFPGATGLIYRGEGGRLVA